MEGVTWGNFMTPLEGQWAGVSFAGTTSPGRHCHFTLSLTVIACHSLGIYTPILLSYSVKMTVSPQARPRCCSSTRCSTRCSASTSSRCRRRDDDVFSTTIRPQYSLLKNRHVVLPRARFCQRSLACAASPGSHSRCSGSAERPSVRIAFAIALIRETAVVITSRSACYICA